MSKVIGNLTNLSIFAQVAQRGSFSAAAETLDLTPSGVSRAVGRMETELGIKLFHRTTRSLSLTSDGRKLLRSSERLLEEWKQLEAWIARDRAELEGSLSISLPSGMGSQVLVEPLVDFQEKHPAVRLHVSFDDRLAGLADDALDLVVRTGRLHDRTELIARKFFDYQVILCASPEYLAKNGMPATPEDLRDHSCLRFRAGGRIFPWRLPIEQEWASGPLVFDDGPAILKATVLGAGISLLATWLSAPALRDGRLVEILPGHRPSSTPCWLVYLNRRFVSPRIQALVDHMVSWRPRIEEAILW